jgi:predicted CoA-binding protein
MHDDFRTAAEILKSARTVAVLGMKGAEQAMAPAHAVPAYLAAHGYTVIPVNPELAAAGYPGAVAALADLDSPPDVVEVFRRADAIDAHVDEIIAAKPKAAWFQLGIRNDAAAERLRAAGITVVQDRCMHRDHHALSESHEIDS